LLDLSERIGLDIIIVQWRDEKDMMILECHYVLLESLTILSNDKNQIAYNRSRRVFDVLFNICNLLNYELIAIILGTEIKY